MHEAGRGAMLFRRRSHVAQASFKLAIKLKTTLKSRSSCLHLQSARITSVHPLTRFMWYWGSNPGLHVCWAGTLSTEPHPSSGSNTVFSLRMMTPQRIPRERSVSLENLALGFPGFPGNTS